ncbi:MAG TPA: pilus assembly PilX N-terminal domain-containing protein [Vicinamibacterales bacterium]|nr:pilus assembly PilX N-terminal domain-containing protein [Vicinamibacterales bacterium]
MRTHDEQGIAMITVMLILMLMSVLLVGFTTVVMSDQRYRFIDRDRGQAFYAASAGIEKLTADVGNLFNEYVAPTAAQVTALTASTALPVISGITFSAAQAAAALPASQLTAYHCAKDPTTGALKTPTMVGTSGYTVTFCALNSTGNPTPSDDNLVISGTGAYAQMTALQSPYQLDVTAKTSTGGEVHLIRTLQSVAIPVFQFMMFSDVDLSTFAGSTFGFAGRIHTNGNLWLAAGGGATTTMTGKITAVKDIVRQYLSNGVSIDLGPTWTGTVSLATAAAAPTGNRNMARTEGSVVGTAGSAATANWGTLSLGATPTYYNGYIKNTATGAKKLSLPITAQGVGGTNVDIIRRPLVGEDPTGILYNERLFTKASIRILLSDTAADILNLPGVTATAPILLDGDWTVAGTPFAAYTGGPIARSMGFTGQLTTTTANTAAGATTISVGAVPAMFLKPQITFKNAAGNNRVGPITCTTWTETSFTGCGAHAALTVANQPIIYVNIAGNAPTTPGNMPGAVNPTTTLGASSALNAATITLAAGSNTFAFAANTFFITDTNAGGGISTPVTCTGATANSFTGCTNVPQTNSGAIISTGYAVPQNTGTIGGYLKIERQSVAGVWTDITQEIMNYGISGPSPDLLCVPFPNAIVQIQRVRDNAGPASCSVGDFTNDYEYWPNALFDAREGLQRDADPGNISTGFQAGGAMYYIAIDAGNLATWFKGQAPYAAGTGNLSRTDNAGYSVYFSDRRSNRNAAALETAEYGFEDFVNPGVANGVPNGVCELPGEDVNGNGICDVYGKTPTYNGVYNTIVPFLAPFAPGLGYAVTNTPVTQIKRALAQTNRPIFFRRALKLTNGAALGSNAVVANRVTGLTVVSENPVYIQGDWNAAATFAVGDLHAATAVIADAVTLLSGSWDDGNSFDQAYNPGGRSRTAQNYVRAAILSGKGPAFPLPSDETVAFDFGTDGGAHNFLRFLEAGGGTVNYRGSMATLFFNRQGVGTYKCCTTVYGAPTRNFIYDTDFTNPSLLPPLTPMFRDMNVIGFSQELRPGK